MKEMAGRGVPVSLSLSVCSVCPFIIFETADMDSAVEGLMDAAFKTYAEVKKRHELGSVLQSVSLSVALS